MLIPALTKQAEQNQANSAIGCKVKTDAVTLSLDTPTRAIWVGTGGTLILTFANGSTGTIPGVPDGSLLPFSATSIAGTATGVVALF